MSETEKAKLVTLRTLAEVYLKIGSHPPGMIGRRTGSRQASTRRCPSAAPRRVSAFRLNLPNSLPCMIPRIWRGRWRPWASRGGS
jgi:hypothetical protein